MVDAIRGFFPYMLAQQKDFSAPDAKQKVEFNVMSIEEESVDGTLVDPPAYLASI